MPARLVTNAAALLAASVLASQAWGDIVVMRDGRRYEGEVVSETSSTVKLHTVAAGVECTLEFARHEVADIEKKPLPEGFFAEPPVSPAPTPPAEPKPASNAIPYLEVPLVGVFGKDFDETAIEDVMTFARLKEIRHLVFTIDSLGGDPEVARRINALMKQNDDRFDYICRLRQSFSASLWVIVRCDRVFVEPGAATGAAVAFTENLRTGEVSVDEKLLSAYAAELSSQAAEKKQLPPPLVRAMVVPEATVYVCEDDHGKVTRILDAEPAAGSGKCNCIDDRFTVVSLTADEAVHFGFASPWESRDVAAGDGWRLYNQYGEAAVRRSRQRAQMCLEVRDRIPQLQQLVDAATNTKPADEYTDYRYERYSYWDGAKWVWGSRMVEASERLHAERDQRWQNAWTYVASAISDMQHTIDRIGKNPPPYVEKVSEAVEAARLVLRQNRR